MKHNSKVALGAMLSALSVVMLLPTALEVLVYALPAVASVFVAFATVEMGKKWALSVFICSSVVGLIIVPNKEAVILYAAFFGYYPILKAYLESRMKKLGEYALKLLVFNLTMVGAYLAMIYLFGIPYEKLMDFGTDLGKFTAYAPWILLAAGNVIFLIFDKGLTGWITYYVVVLQKKFRKLFRFTY